ncbi:hypothetical protein ElyMa_006366400 [Elysia marginata]|uniref:Uncharacterized protein n=1 Tax=Elysia marginata TaxID=1093978 RepID=A0AAV4HR82_9GAST|nr:hypothetical protein ElyMa_006366400 [Elysia marginata]
MAWSGIEPTTSRSRDRRAKHSSTLTSLSLVPLVLYGAENDCNRYVKRQAAEQPALKLGSTATGFQLHVTVYVHRHHSFEKIDGFKVLASPSLAIKRDSFLD